MQYGSAASNDMLGYACMLVDSNNEYVNVRSSQPSSWYMISIGY